MPVTIGGSGPITGVTSINTTVSDTELGYLDGVTSALQTQINAKANDSSQGLYLITPSSIANSGGSASASGGKITFSAVNSVSLNGVFTTTYDAYRIVIRMTGSAAAADMTYRNRLSGNDAATNYNWQYLTAANTTVAAALNASQTSAYVGSYRSAGQAETWVDVYGAALAEETGIFATNRDRNGGASIGLFSSLHTTATAYDGFSLIASTGTITGTVRVYGYKN